MKNLLIVVVGPTGVGKTDLCLRLARQLETAIVNADSRQIFRELPIGTAAPTLSQQQEVKHYMVGTHSITDYYSAAMFENDALSAIENIFSEGHSTAILSGGSMMYVDAVCKGIDDIPTIDEGTRTLYKRRLQEEGLERLCEELERVDPAYYQIVDRRNQRRVVHALEICHVTGKTYTSFRVNRQKSRPFDILKVGLNIPREILYNRINRRVVQMIKDGLEEEAHKVYPLRHLTSLSTVGYREMFAYFDGQFTLEEAIERIQGHTRQYARKQLTWLKRDESIRWFQPDEWDEILQYVMSEMKLRL
ncbi:tRNA (adenosine(37)-N6)-dimethylallyltransferase MiaA [Bacteroides heparinolyticus]|uniref:tRNA (adenosine(37)-N6)-dimethylallyltransferase MiaA n=1 Tax=Prevotella heparinolytica TaxID=28113 RepID=UPI0035A18AC7